VKGGKKGERNRGQGEKTEHKKRKRKKKMGSVGEIRTEGGWSVERKGEKKKLVTEGEGGNFLKHYFDNQEKGKPEWEKQTRLITMGESFLKVKQSHHVAKKTRVGGKKEGQRRHGLPGDQVSHSANSHGKGAKPEKKTIL